MKRREREFVVLVETLRALSPKTGAGVLVVAACLIMPGFAPSAPLLLSLVGEKNLARTYNALWAAGVTSALPPLAPIVGVTAAIQDQLLDPLAEIGRGVREIF